MPTIADRLRHVELKLKRAKEHISDAERQHAAFIATNPYRVATKHHPETRKLIYYVSCAHPIPESLALIAGDVIQNLMSALDHLAYQLVCSDTRDNPPKPWKIYFPIFDSATEYETEKTRKMQGAHQDTFKAIDTLKPYKGGNDGLWSLQRLNNIEKHRLLFTVGAKAAGFNVAQDMARRMTGTSFPAEAVEALSKMSIFIRPADTGFPLKEGFELFIGAIDEKPDPNQEFRFEVAFDEPGVIEGKPLLVTLHQLTTFVEGIVTALSGRLVSTP